MLATQTLWQRRPKQMRITIAGPPGPHVSAKDLILAISRMGAAGAVGHAIEFAGPAVRALSMEARMTLCNMAIEAGSRTGMVARRRDHLRLARRPAARAAGRRVRPGGRDWRAPCPPTPPPGSSTEIALDAGTVTQWSP